MIDNSIELNIKGFNGSNRYKLGFGIKVICMRLYVIMLWI
ncbi:hypothetical protein H04402_02407 [Clostridium botulinum H04402 065]|nr:hypothetical protein H04402_02407 [Clostridium botulinum H04402 065]